MKERGKAPVYTVEISQHAMLRLRERVVNHAGYRDWQDLVRTARYKGKTKNEMTTYEYDWYMNNIRSIYPSSQVRILNGFAFIFMGNHGHARTLITVIRID